MKKDVRRFIFTSLAIAGVMVAVIVVGTAQARPLPDLVVSLSAPAAAGAGADIGPQVRLIVKNLGNAQALGTTGNPTGYMVDLTLGQIRAVAPGFATFSPNYAEDVLLKGGRVSVTVNLLPQDFREYAVGAGIPHDTPAGRYFLCATVDPGAVIAESNEDNNTTWVDMEFTEGDEGVLNVAVTEYGPYVESSSPAQSPPPGATTMPMPGSSATPVP